MPKEIATKNTPKKPLLEQILEWSEQSLPDWQRDGLRRLFQRTSAELTAADYNELYALLKKGNGLPTADGLAAKRASAEHKARTTSTSRSRRCGICKQDCARTGV